MFPDPTPGQPAQFPLPPEGVLPVVLDDEPEVLLVVLAGTSEQGAVDWQLERLVGRVVDIPGEDGVGGVVRWGGVLFFARFCLIRNSPRISNGS